MAFNSNLRQGAALQAAARSARSTPGLGVSRNTQVGNPRYGMTYRTVDVQGQRVHVYNDGTRIKVGPRRVPSVSPARAASPRPGMNQGGPSRSTGTTRRGIGAYSPHP